MTTVDMLKNLADWLLADPSHIVVLATTIAAITPTPDPASWAGKLYKIVDILAGNFLHAKDTGTTQVPVTDIVGIIASAVSQVKATTVVPLPPVTAAAPTTQATGLPTGGQ